jgi:hypothetical protein
MAVRKKLPGSKCDHPFPTIRLIGQVQHLLHQHPNAIVRGGGGFVGAYKGIGFLSIRPDHPWRVGQPS